MPAVAPFSDEETSAIERLPFLVFFLVAGSDGKVDDQEFNAFVNDLMDVATGEGEGHEDASVVHRLLANSSRYFESLHPQTKREVIEGGLDFILQTLEEGAALLDGTLDIHSAKAYKTALCHLGRAVAEASGGLLGIGNVSKDEKEALIKLSALLGVSA